MADRVTNAIVVAAAIVERDGSFLVTRRLQGTHLAGTWEFPGGKCEAGESLVDCLRRELREELGVDAEVGGEVLQVSHDYGDRQIRLHFLRCVLHGDPVPQLGQDMRWVDRRLLNPREFPPADAELIQLLMER